MHFISIRESESELVEYVKFHKHRNIFQSFELFNVYEASRNHTPFVYALKSESGQLLAIVFGVVQTYFGKPLKNLTSRALISGGPLLSSDDPEILSYFLGSLKKELSRNSLIIQFRNLWNWGNLNKVFNDEGFRYLPHSDIFIRLDQPKTELIAKINKNKRRNVTKTLNKRTKIRLISGIDEFRSSVFLIKKAYKKLLLPFPDESLFFESFRQLSDSGILKVFVAEYDGTIIGVRMELVYGDIIYDWYAGSDSNFNNYYPNDVLIYNILEWGVSKYKVFDFGGAGNPNIPYAVRDYKLNFGGELIENGRYEFVLKKVSNTLFSTAFSTYKLFRSCLRKLQIKERKDGSYHKS